MRIKTALTTSYQNVGPSEGMSGGRVAELDTFYIANNSNTATSVSVAVLSTIDEAITETPGGNRLIPPFTIPAGDVLDVLEGGTMTLEKGERIHAKAAVANYLDVAITYNVKERL